MKLDMSLALPVALILTPTPPSLEQHSYTIQLVKLSWLNHGVSILICSVRARPGAADRAGMMMG